MKLQGRRIVATMLVVVGLGAMVGGCYYAVPAPPPPPGSVFVRGRWVWNGYTWLWQPGYWIAPAPPPWSDSSVTPAGARDPSHATANAAVDPRRTHALDEGLPHDLVSAHCSGGHPVPACRIPA
jgi:hypothetical protein